MTTERKGKTNRKGVEQNTERERNRGQRQRKQREKRERGDISGRWRKTEKRAIERTAFNQIGWLQIRKVIRWRLTIKHTHTHTHTHTQQRERDKYWKNLILKLQEFNQKPSSQLFNGEVSV